MMKTAKHWVWPFVISIYPYAATADDTLLDTVKKACKKEIDSYCQQVQPGEGRMLACFYAHKEKISGRCEYALYDASAQLQRQVAALSYVANECADDLDSHCSSVAVGQGRLLQCLEKNDGSVSKRCKVAIEDVGLR